MQALAREMNFSESTFVLPAEKGGDFRMRIFTPVREMPFAGHPTLGTAFAMAGPLQSPLVRIETADGDRPGDARARGREARVRQDGAADSDSSRRGATTRRLLAALGVESSRLPIEVYDNGVRHVYVMLPSFADVAAVRPDLQALEAAAGEAGVNVFAVEDGHVKTRMFMLDVGHRRGSRDRLGSRAARGAPGAMGRDSVGRGDRHLAGRRDRTSEHAVRPSARGGRRCGSCRGRRRSGRGGARRVQAVAGATHFRVASVASLQ